MPNQMTKDESAAFLNGCAPAFAIPNLFGPNGEALCEGTPGLTKREYFAAMAMQGILMQERPTFGSTTESMALVCAAEAVKCADALLAELAK